MRPILKRTVCIRRLDSSTRQNIIMIARPFVSDWGGADALFHHIQDDVRAWHCVARRQIGTRGIVVKLEMAETTLLHLMEDVGVSVGAGVEEPPVPQNLPVVPAPLTVE